MKRYFRKSLQNVLLGALNKQDDSLRESRRKFISQMGLLSSAYLLNQPLFPRSFNPDILIVGGGIAGLNAAYTLQKQGLVVPVFEASSRVGGRMMTLNNYFENGVNTEMGGEFIDAYHEDLLQLVEDFQLDLTDLRDDDSSLNDMIYFDNKRRSQEELIEEVLPFAAKLRADLERFPENLDDISYMNSSAWSDLDALSISQYLDQIGMKGWIKSYFYHQMSAYYTMDASMQSAVNMFLLLDIPEKEEKVTDDQSEVFKIKGGSEKLTQTMGNVLKDQIHLGHALIEIHREKKGGYMAVFEVLGKRKRVYADYLILTLPFSKLREVKTIGFNWSPLKKKCIDSLGYGNGGKICFGLKEPVWRNHGFHGGLYCDFPAYSGWDSSRMQGGQKGVFTVFGGGSIGNDAASKTAAELRNSYLPGLEKVWPGFNDTFENQLLHKFSWQDYYFNLGSYTSYKVGQWSAFGGVEKEPEGNIFFAGEHCSIQFQGYMNGGAQTGRIAAEKVMEKINGEFNSFKNLKK